MPFAIGDYPLPGKIVSLGGYNPVADSSLSECCFRPVPAALQTPRLARMARRVFCDTIDDSLSSWRLISSSTRELVYAAFVSALNAKMGRSSHEK